MASNISYFGSMIERNSDQPDNSTPSCVWNHTLPIGSNVAGIKCPYTQLRVLFEQSLAAAYYLKFYGPRCHEVINDFVEELNQDISLRFAAKHSRSFTDNFKRVYDALMSLVKFNRGGHWVDLDVDLIMAFLFDGKVDMSIPHVWTEDAKGNVAAFIMFMNKKVDDNHVSMTFSKVGVDTCSLCRVWEAYSTNTLCVRFEHHYIDTTVIASKTPLDEMNDNVSVLAYLSHFNWHRSSFEAAVGIIREFNLHNDIEKFGLSLTHILAYSLNGCCGDLRFNLCGYNDGIRPRYIPYKDTLFTVMVSFVKHCSAYRGMKLIDKEFIAKAFGCLAASKQNRDTVAYLMEHGATPSAEQHKAFMQTMGSVESLVLISQKPTLMTAQTGNQEATVATEATDGEDNKGTKEGQQSDNQAADQKNEPTGEPSKEGDDDKSPPSRDDDGADDLPSDDTTGEEVTDQPTESDNNNEPGSGSSDPSAPGTSSAQPENTPEPVTTSDDEGVPFEIQPPDSSTVDAVIFREEMYKFLSNVLTNPPKCMSPQDIETLNALRRFWLSCLSIDTIKGIVEACIRLPKSLKNSIRKSTEQKQ